MSNRFNCSSPSSRQVTILALVALALLAIGVGSSGCSDPNLRQFKTPTNQHSATLVETEEPAHLKKDIRPSPYTKDEKYTTLDDWEGGVFMIHWPSGKRGQGHPKVAFLNMGNAKHISLAKILEIKSHQEIRGTVRIFKTPQTTLLEDGEVRITRLPMAYVTRKSGKCRRYIKVKNFRDDVLKSCVKNVCGTVYQLGEETKLDLECKDKPTNKDNKKDEDLAYETLD